MVSFVEECVLYLKMLLYPFRPSKEKTGHVSDSGASVIKHGLNPEKIFLQVHYLKVSTSWGQEMVVMAWEVLAKTGKVSDMAGTEQKYHCPIGKTHMRVR